MLRRSFLSRSLAVSGLGTLGYRPLWAQGGVAIPEAAGPTGKLTFLATRGGSDIGNHVIEVTRSADQVTVNTTTNIAVRMLMITAYRFIQSSHEVWRAGRLVEFKATTDDDGTKNQIEARAAGSGLDIVVDGKKSSLPGNVIPASLWNPRLVQQSRLFDTADGRPLNVNVKLAGTETLQVRGARTPTQKFAITGDMQRDIWYDAAWVPVQASFLATKDKSVIRFALT